jgi:hypothetical protein
MKWNSRKLYIAVGFTSLWAFLCWEGTLSGDHLVTLVLICLGGYFGANVAEHYANRGER